MKKKRKNLLQEFDILDVFSEQNRLSNEDILRMKEIKEDLTDIWKKEETAMWQRSRDSKIMEGDKNTTYFHVVANQRRRKNHLSVLREPCGPVYSTKDILEVATDFYKNLFGPPDISSVSLNIDNPTKNQEKYEKIPIEEIS